LRGAWVSRFAYAHENPDSMKMKIINTMQNLAEANFNAVFFQLRGQCETFYPSPYEPWSKLIGYKNPGFDPAQLAIDEARKNGLAFYAYINLLPLWNEVNPPQDSSHIYFQHGPKTDATANWTLIAESDSDQVSTSYFYLNPARPEVKTYLKKIIRHFVENYDIDGLHFDRIRYPGANFFQDSYSKKQFQKDSIETGISRDDWARKALTDLVEAVVVEAMTVKPYLINSAASWGLYKTNDIPGYEEFGSGFATYYQDAIDWLDHGIVDFIVPMIYWNMENPLPNFNALWLDFKNRTPNYQYIFPGLRIYDCDWVESGETKDQIEFVRKNDGLGTVVFALGSEKDEKIKIFRDSIYQEKIDIPKHLKRTSTTEVYQLSLKKLLPENPAGQRVKILNTPLVKRTDSDGKIDFILKKSANSLKISCHGDTLPVLTQFWTPPYKYNLLPDSTYEREKPWVELRRKPAKTTRSNEFPFLFKSDYPVSATINNKPVKQYKTGIFFDVVSFDEGPNRVTAKVEYEDGSSAVYSDEFVYHKESTKSDTFPLWIDENSFEPAKNLELLPKDNITIKFKASAGQEAEIVISGYKYKFLRTDFDDYSLYETLIPARKLDCDKALKMKIHLTSKKGSDIQFSPEHTITIKHFDEFPLIRTTSENSILYYTLGEIRLGGPIRAEYGPGVILKTSGKIGTNYRIRLNESEIGYIDEKEVEILTSRVKAPAYYIAGLSCYPSKTSDIVSIPYPENVPYAVYPEPGQRRIAISLYGVQTSSTWLTHHKGRKIIDKVTWQQETPDTYTLYVNLKNSEIWGYDIKKSGKSLIFSVKHPPVLPKNSTQPLSGLKIALEAGHGGSNLGAVGLSGILEKDINLSLAFMLQEILEEKGAEVLQVRDADKPMLLGVKRESAISSGADMLVSIHANAGGIRNGYLGASGTSTYYHNPFWAPLAEKIYNRLLELDLSEFGVVGSFNYKVTRVSAIPSVLVEQAFMSNAEDEEKLADPIFRKEMAEKIYLGILDYLDHMKQ